MGRKQEVVAKESLENLLKDKILNCGLFIHRLIPGLAATPDGILQTSGNLVEIKCLFSASQCPSITDAYLNNVKAISSLYTNESCTEVRTSHEYYYQIQMQLNVAEIEFCYLFVWIPNDGKVT